MILDQQQRNEIRQMERGSRYLTGIGQIDRDDCPLLACSPISCMFCRYGHMLECHYPLSCEEARCSHYQELDEHDRV